MRNIFNKRKNLFLLFFLFVLVGCNAYDNSSDYVKTFDVIRAFRITETGEIKVVFSSGYNQNEG